MAECVASRYFCIIFAAIAVATNQLSISLPFADAQPSESALQTIYLVKLWGANEIQLPGSPAASGDAKLAFDSQRSAVSFKIK